MSLKSSDDNEAQNTRTTNAAMASSGNNGKHVESPISTDTLYKPIPACPWQL